MKSVSLSANKSAVRGLVTGGHLSEIFDTLIPACPFSLQVLLLCWDLICSSYSTLDDAGSKGDFMIKKIIGSLMLLLPN